jgi:hypothetical protein
MYPGVHACPRRPHRGASALGSQLQVYLSGGVSRAERNGLETPVGDSGGAAVSPGPGLVGGAVGHYVVQGAVDCVLARGPIPVAQVRDCATAAIYPGQKPHEAGRCHCIEHRPTVRQSNAQRRFALGRP